MRILVSACLIGVNCRYNAEPVMKLDLEKLMERHELIPVCPEQLGGLPTPREPSEIQGDRVVMKSGRDVTEEYRRGAEETLRLAKLFGCNCALMKERSPSCGFGEVYDGRFSGTLCAGNGVTAGLLSENGIEVFGESRADELM